MSSFTQIFDASDFPARWNCGAGWKATPGYGWLHILSDLGIWSAYLAIPCVLAYFIVRRRDIPFRSLFLLFGAFIFACGTTHLMDAVIFWWPAYRLAAVIKLLTAIVSWATVFALIPVVPKVLAMRSPEELERVIAARTTAEEELHHVNAELERRVLERTAELTQAVAALGAERELLRTTLGSIGDGVIATDNEKCVTFLNPVAETLTGWSSADAAGVPLEQVFRIVNETSRQPVENPALRALTEGVIVGLANHTLLIARDGTERPIDDSAAPIRNASGVVAGSVLVFRDITKRKREEAAAAERTRLIALRADISAALASSGSTPEILQCCSEALVRHLDAAFARVWTLNEAENVLELQASAGLYTHLNGPHSRVKVGEFKIGRIAANRQPHLTNSVPDDPNVSDRAWAAREGMVAFAGYPLLIGERVLGVVAMFARQPLTEGILSEVAPLAEGIAQFIERKLAEQELRQAEDRLRRSEARFRTFAENGPQMVWATDAGGASQYVNSRWCEYTGLTPAETADRERSRLVIHPEDYPRMMESWSEAQASDNTFTVEFRIKRAADGAYRWFLCRAVPVRDDEGRIVQWLGANVDIDDSKRAEREIVRLAAESERQKRLYEAILTTTPDLAYLFSLDHRFTYTNPALLALWGRTREEAIGKTCLEIGYEPWHAALHEREIDQVVATRQPIRGEVPFAAPAGRRIFDYIFTPVIGVEGEVEAVAGTTRDITDQKRAQESSHYLAEASAALASVVDPESTLQTVANLAVPYFADWSAADVANDDGSLRRIAVAHRDPEKVRLAHELAGRYPIDMQAGSGIGAVYRTGKPEILGEISDDLLVKGAKDPDHLRLIRSLGLKSYICVPLVVAGKSYGVLSFFTAESDRRYSEVDLALARELSQRAAIAIENARLYAELREADRRKDEFLATLAHELRNPLAPIRNGLQVMRLAGGEKEMAERARTMMERQLTQLVRLVDDLMDVSRISRGKIELRKERLPLSTMLTSAVETSRPLIEKMGHELAISLPPQPVMIDADLTRLAQVFSNLLNNAAKYSEPCGHIWLRAEHLGGEVIVSVRDAGIGIAADQLPHIFEMFTQTESALEKAQGGLGIGLTLVKRLVEMHGGSVAAKSDGPGRGSEFTVRLPVAVETSASEPQGVEEESAIAPSKLRILIVDDNRDAAESLTMMLEILGNEIRTAYDGEEAVRAALEFQPDVILLDIGLPKLNGYEACRRIRRQQGGKNAVIIAQTGWGQEEDRERTHQAGFDQHLVKPIDPSVLMAILSELSQRAASQAQSVSPKANRIS